MFPDGDVASYLLDPQGRVETRTCDEYDVLNVVTASMLYEVIEGERGWGEPLLTGQLRCAVRGATVRAGAIEPLEVAPVFLYYALSYRESLERAALHRAERAITAMR